MMFKLGGKRRPLACRVGPFRFWWTIRTVLQVSDLTRFLYANRHPLHSKALLLARLW